MSELKPADILATLVVSMDCFEVADGHLSAFVLELHRVERRGEVALTVETRQSQTRARTTIDAEGRIFHQRFRVNYAEEQR